jgi:transcriptional regulator
MLYNPRAFQAGNAQAMALIEQYPFATLVSWDQDCQISHLPMYLSEDKAELVGHFAGANPHEHTAVSHRHVAVFQGPNAYISAGWYAAPNQVPTWNYQVVHLAGPLRLIQDRSEKLRIVDRLSEIHEAPFDPAWTTSKMDQSTLDQMLDHITGFTLKIETIDAKFKISQNKPLEQPNILEGLSSRPDNQAMVDAMTDNAMKRSEIKREPKE